MSLPIGEEIIRQEPEETIFTMDNGEVKAPATQNIKESSTDDIKKELMADEVPEPRHKGAPPSNLPFE